MGLPWRGRKGACSYLLELLEREKVRDLCSFFCGALPFGAVKVGQFRRGDIFLLELNGKIELLDDAVKKGACISNNKCKVQTWGYVNAVDERLEFKPLIFKELSSYSPRSTSVYVKLLKLPDSAAEKAAELHMLPPV